ncbi:hypothetical protein HYR99_11485 [Candidatus Poribacteria bacterium]|nr:hypothetical protein [Candidatus Poribacteria bacterium]
MANGNQLQAITKSKLLLVEGPDDLRFFKALLRHLDLQDIEVGIYDGKDNLRPFLKALPAIPEFAIVKSLGIIRDADDKATTTFQSVHDALLNANLPAPDAPLVLQPGQPQVAVMIMPPSANEGMLEHLCLSAARDDPAMPCVDSYFQCIKAQTGNLPPNMAKAKVHAFLASKEKSYLRIGEAAEKGYWYWDNLVYDPVKRFINQL